MGDYNWKKWREYKWGGEVIDEGSTLLEKKELNQRFIDDIADDTDRNNHTEARIKISKAMGWKTGVRFYEAMEVLNDIFRGDGPEQSKLKQKMEKELYRQMLRSFSNYDEIYNAL
tara:strand:- start:3 stop:347 length:345 start_codon:yes stop_codon:yes gene_type:complete